MNLLRTIGSVAIGAAKFLFGVPSGASSSPIETVAKTVDEYKYTDEEKAKDAITEVESAREWQPPKMPSTPIELSSMGFLGMIAYCSLSVVDKIVDSLNHAIRPGVLVWLIGGLSGAWPLPALSNIDPFWESALYLILTFFYGGRMFFKDLPAFINALRAFRGK